MAKKVERSSMTQKVNGKVTRKAREDDSMRAKFFWWKKRDSPQAMAEEICNTIRFIGKHQSSRLDQLTASTRLYGNNSSYNLIGGAFPRTQNTQSNPSSSRISFNLCASVVDTLTAQQAKNKVVPTFITSGGIWGMQRKAENLSKFVEGMFYEQNIHEKQVYQFRDSGVWGDGILYIYRDDEDRAAAERVLPHELLFDLVESQVGRPRQLHRVKIADRGVLCEMFPESADQIMTANPSNYQDTGGDATAADLITVAQSWHLRSGKDAEDGVCAITLPDTGVVLDQYDYEKDYFPFVIQPYSKRLLGPWGQGAVERLQNIQGEVNRGMITIQKSLWLQGGPKVFIKIGSKIVSQHINNELGTIIHGNEPPIYFTPPCVQPEIYTWVDSLITKGYQQEGCSQLQANNLKPLGVNSGAALRDYDNISQDRQLFISQIVEKCGLEIARQAIEIVKDVFAEKGEYKVNYPNSNFLESIDWKDVNLEMDEYWLKAFPTSELPEEPTAKLETVQEYAQAGFISPRAARRLLSMPDVEMADKLANAAEDLICKSIEDILYDGKSVIPDDEWDLQLAYDYCLKYLNYAKLNNCPEGRIEKLREFKGYIADAMKLTMPPPPPVMPGAAPLAAPQPTPTSDLIPNVVGAAA